MLFSTTSGLVVAAITIGEAVAGPAHAHMHRKLHERQYDVDWSKLDWNNMGIDWSSAWAAGQKTQEAAPPPAATTVAAVTTTAAPVVQAVTTTSAAPVTQASAPPAGNVVSSLVNDVAMLFNNLQGASNSRTSFGGSTGSAGVAGDNYKGNVGSPYGSNVIKVASAEGNQFSITFENTASQGMTVNIWQKVGPDGQVLSGSALAPKSTTLTFYLAAGASQVVAVQDNTQIAWAQSVSEFTASGAFLTTWGEANLASGGSGYDVSAINNPTNNYDMTITSAEASGCTSSRTENFWLTPTDPVGTSDGSCFIAQNTATIHVAMGGTI